MVGLIGVGLVLGGLVLAFAGGALSVYGVGLVGFVLGAVGGFVIAPQVLGMAEAGGMVALAVAILVGGALGLLLAYAALSFATAVPGFIVGAFVGLYIVSPLFLEGGLVRYVAAIIGGLAGAAFGYVLTRQALVVITAFLGAALASRSLTIETFEAARDGFTVDPLLFDPFDVVFLVILVLGLLVQVGLFRLGWVARFAAAVPGIGRVLGDDE